MKLSLEKRVGSEYDTTKLNLA